MPGIRIRSLPKAIEGKMREAIRAVAILGLSMVVCSLFLDWYRFDEFGFTITQSGWKAFHSADVALFAMAAAGLALVVKDALGETRKGALALAGLIGLAAVALSLVKMLSPPAHVDGLEFGAFLSLAGSAIWALAGFAELIDVPGTLPTAKSCPDCRMAVPRTATVCRHCGYRFGPAPTMASQPPEA
jgi:hypothetical protein